MAVTQRNAERSTWLDVGRIYIFQCNSPRSTRSLLAGQESFATDTQRYIERGVATFGQTEDLLRKMHSCSEAKPYELSPVLTWTPTTYP